MSFLSSLFSRNVQPADYSAVDVVIYLASFVSDHDKIDTQLDVLRVVTSRIGPDKLLTEQDQLTLAVLFKNLEDYVLANETAFQADRPALHAKIKQKFPEPNKREELFWQVAVAERN